LRAYVFPIEAKLTKFSAEQVSECRVVIHNSGQTSAYRLAHVTRFALVDFPLKGSFPECKASEANSMTNIAPDGKIDKFGAAHWPLSEAAVIKLGKGEAAIYVYGRIDFIDAFGRRRWISMESALRAEKF
jgi:hypothetical protein